MFDKLKARRQDTKDGWLLEKYKKRDARLGTPTLTTLTERALAAARDGYWKTAMGSFQQGGDLKAGLEYKLEPDKILSRKVRRSAVFFAIEQDRPNVLRELFRIGADPRGDGEICHMIHWYKDPLLAFAAAHGSASTMRVLLDAGGGPAGNELDQALSLAAGRPGQGALVETLLAHGAKGFEAALLVAEKADNGGAILLIRAAEKAAGAAQPNAAEIDLARREKALETALDGLEEGGRRLLLERLRARFSADFEAVASKTAEAAGPRPPQPVKISIKM